MGIPWRKHPLNNPAVTPSFTAFSLGYHHRWQGLSWSCLVSQIPVFRECAFLPVLESYAKIPPVMDLTSYLRGRHSKLENLCYSPCLWNPLPFLEIACPAGLHYQVSPAKNIYYVLCLVEWWAGLCCFQCEVGFLDHCIHWARGHKGEQGQMQPQKSMFNLFPQKTVKCHCHFQWSCPKVPWI